MRTLACIGPAKALLAAQAWLYLPAAAALRLVPFERVARLAAARASANGACPAPDGTRSAQGCAQLVDTVARPHLWRFTCLRRALVLQRLLGEAGLACELRFGVRYAEGSFSAHAWVEYAGLALGEAGRISGAFHALESTAPAEAIAMLR
jgi:Transglutaminase-like superfamily